MKKKSLLFCTLFLCSLMMVGCQREVSTEEFEVDSLENTVSDSMDIDTDEIEQDVIGTLSHGVEWSANEEEYAFTYDGGALDIPYGMIGSGICKKSGFLLYLNGIPQPYIIKGVDEEYKYFHAIEGNDNEDKGFVISFVPVTGKVGDKLWLSINSVANPDFIPDMVNTFDYGMSHQSVEALYNISFKKDAEEVPKAVDELYAINNVSNDIADIDKDKEKYIADNLLETKLDLDKSIYDVLTIDDNSMLIDSKLNIKDKNTIHISYMMMGHPGVKYKVCFYLNHNLLRELSTTNYDVELIMGKMNTIEFDLDVSNLNDGTFYLVTVPLNADDYPDDAIGTKKLKSIHLYRGE